MRSLWQNTQTNGCENAIEDMALVHTILCVYALKMRNKKRIREKNKNKRIRENMSSVSVA